MERPAVELWVDDHQEYEPGVVHAHLRHARVPLDPRAAARSHRLVGLLVRCVRVRRCGCSPRPGDYLVVGDDEIEPALAEVLSRSESGALRLRLLPGPATRHRELLEARHPVPA